MGRSRYLRLAASSAWSIAVVACAVVHVQLAIVEPSAFNLVLAVGWCVAAVCNAVGKSIAEEAAQVFIKDSPEWDKLVDDLVKDIESSVVAKEAK